MCHQASLRDINVPRRYAINSTSLQTAEKIMHEGSLQLSMKRRRACVTLTCKCRSKQKVETDVPLFLCIAGKNYAGAFTYSMCLPL